MSVLTDAMTKESVQNEDIEQLQIMGGNCVCTIQWA